MRKCVITERLDWSQWLSPRTFSHLPVHCWYLFPHSFSPEFVAALAREWKLGASDRILDPFLGSGTTALSAQNLGIPCSGYDLSPLASFVAQAKCERPSAQDVQRLCGSILAKGPLPDTYPDHADSVEPFLERAFGEGRLAKLLALAECIRSEDAATSCRSFLMLALLGIVPQFALAERNGGWLRWRGDARPASQIESAFAQRVCEMAQDLTEVGSSSVSTNHRAR